MEQPLHRSKSLISLFSSEHGQKERGWSLICLSAKETFRARQLGENNVTRGGDQQLDNASLHRASPGMQWGTLGREGRGCWDWRHTDKHYGCGQAVWDGRDPENGQ